MNGITRSRLEGLSQVNDNCGQGRSARDRIIIVIRIEDQFTCRCVVDLREIKRVSTGNTYDDTEVEVALELDFGLLSALGMCAFIGGCLVPGSSHCYRKFDRFEQARDL